MEYIKICLYAIIPMAIIFFIINNAIPTHNYARRALVMLAITGVIVLVFAGGVIFDINKFGTSVLTKWPYWLAVGAIIIALIVFVVINFVKAKKFNHHAKQDKRRYEKEVSQYLYILYRYGGMFYLAKEKQTDKYAGIVVPFDRKNYFYDEMINSYFKENNIKVNDYHLVGTATTYKKKKMIFYCFIVDLDECEVTNSLERISPFEIHKLDMLDLHKTLILKILIGEAFNIEL